MSPALVDSPLAEERSHFPRDSKMDRFRSLDRKLPVCAPVTCSRNATSRTPRRGVCVAASSLAEYLLRLSCRQFLVGDPALGRGSDQAVKPLKGVALHVALVQPECELVDVAGKVLVAGVVVVMVIVSPLCLVNEQLSESVVAVVNVPAVCGASHAAHDLGTFRIVERSGRVFH